MRILLVDDNKASALPVQAFLRQQGYRVSYVESGTAAVEAYRAEAPDLVLMDVVMPEMDGIEATRRIKAQGGARWVPLVLMTSLPGQEAIIAGFEAGADDYLIKPLNFEVLNARMRSMKRIASIQDNLFGVLDNVYEAILTIDQFGTVLSYNKAAERIFEYPAVEVIGANVKMLMPPPYTEEHDGYLARYLREHTPRVIGTGRTVRGRRKNGEVFAMHLAVTEMRGSKGPQFVGMISDISAAEAARAAAEASAQAIAQGERFIRTITDSVPGLVAYWDRDLRCRFANRPYLEWFGKPPELIIGNTIRELMGAELFARNEPHIRAALGGEPQNFEQALTKADGSTGYTWANYIPDIDAGGEVAGFFVLVTDVTPIKVVEQALAASEARLRLAMNAARISLWEADLKAQRFRLDERWNQLAGYEAKEAVISFDRLLSMLPAQDAEQLRAHTAAVIQGERTDYFIQHRVRHRDGHLFWVESRGQVVAWDDSGVPTRMTGVSIDITERKNAERLKSEFISTVSHELRTPLTSIAGALGLLAGGALGELSNKAQGVVDIAHKNSKRLSLLINDLLDMEKLIAGKIPFDLQEQPLVPLLRYAVESLHAYAEQYQVRFLLLEPSDELRVLVDGARLHQVLNNFLSNAAKFSPTGGQVEVAVVLEPGRVRVNVIDHGQGVPADFRSRIFEKFSQADASDERKRGGTGLGLAISKEIVERMSGLVGFESEEGRGSCFYFELPLCPGRESASGQA